MKRLFDAEEAMAAAKIPPTVYLTELASPLGVLSLASDGAGLTGLWMEGQKYFQASLKRKAPEICSKTADKNKLPIFLEAEEWLSLYFRKMQPPISQLSLAPAGTSFQKEIWKLLCQIPYGQTTTYGALAKEASIALGKPSMSAQAVGQAVGHNPISILIPCHRVIGSNGSLTGYAGGLEKKRLLLEHEGARFVKAGK